jgi:hypothetical protein
MSEVKVNKISPRTNCGTVTLGDSGDTFTIPAGASIINNGTATGFGPTGAVSWNTTAVTSSPLTAASGVGYFIDTSGGAITVNLPAGSAGAIISLADYTNTWQTNNVTVTPNGSEKINGGAGSVILSTEGQSLTLLYVDSTEGWKSVQDSTTSPVGNNFVTATGGTITTSGDYKIHTFTGPGTFTVTSAGNPLGSTTVDYLVVAGGGGGTNSNACSGKGLAGGGAGGVRFYASPDITSYPASPRNGPAALPVSVQGYPITVGSGGTKGSPACSSVTNGNNSVFSTITSAGGGKAGNNASRGGGPGGSGGGASRDGGPGGTAGSGNTPPTSPSQGSNGGSQTAPGGNASAGGGGGFMVVGSSDTRPFPQPADSAQPGGAGGGFPTSFVATNGQPSGGYQYFGGGGGGGSFYTPSVAGTGGLGGGGTGGGCGGVGTDGTTNTGGGGGGSRGSTTAGAGGSGIVIIRYKFQ